MATVMDVRLKRSDKTYRPGDTVSGFIIVQNKGVQSHNGISLTAEGVAQLQLSSKSIGAFQAFYDSIKPITMLSLSFDVAKPGKLPDGTSEIPFEFKLAPSMGQQLYETYHGVFVNISYQIRCDMKRGMLSKDLSRTLEFMVEIPTPPESIPAPPEDGKTRVDFNITPDKVDNVKRNSRKKLPKFSLSGHLDTAVCDIRKAFTGMITVHESEAVIKSIELQLVRVETCGCADGYAKEPTEIQNIQVAEGDVARGIPLRLHMVFPRMFTCPSIATRTFKVEFEVNLVVMLEDNHVITEGFPITLVRYP